MKVLKFPLQTLTVGGPLCQHCSLLHREHISASNFFIFQDIWLQFSRNKFPVEMTVPITFHKVLEMYICKAKTNVRHL